MENKQSFKNLIILRGLPGSGKTSLANLISEFVCSADDFLMEGKEYVWTPPRLRMAHQKCLEKCEWGMIASISKITVANTNATDKELKPYIELAKKYNYNVHTIIVENRHDSVSIHDVPESTLIKMKNRFSIKL